MMRARCRPTAPACPCVRPAVIDAVVRLEARCRPEDLLANRLDPWHGVHYHAHTFRACGLSSARDDEITVRVAFAVIGRLAVEVDARFHCPDPRTIVMTIVQGDGVGSVVETHATPINETHCAVIEADAGHLGPARSEVRAAAGPLGAARGSSGGASRLWVEDVAYAERRRVVQDQERPERSSR